MRSHRLVLTAFAVLGSLAAAGCGSGRDTEAFLTQGPGNAAVAAAPATPAPAEVAPPVVIAGPDEELVAERDQAKAAAAANQSAAEKADKKRKAARKELREERAKAARARKRAAAREAFLRKALDEAGKRKPVEAGSATPKPVADEDPPTSGSSTEAASLVAERDRRQAAEARAAVVRFHELLDNRDARACDLLTEKLLTATYGAEDGALERCRAAVAAIASEVGVVVAESRAHAGTASVAVVSRFGDSEVAQTLELVLVDGTWLVDAVERKPAS